MKMHALGVAIALVAACKSNPALPDAPPIMIDAAPDATPFVDTVHGTITQLSSSNDGSGGLLTHEGPADPVATHLTVTLDDGSTAVVLLSTEGAFEFGLHTTGQHYRLNVAVDGATPKDYQSGATTLSIAQFGAGRADRDAVTGEVPIKVVFGNWVDGDTAILDTTGLWTSTPALVVTSPLQGQTEPWAFEWTWTTNRSLSGALGLIDAAAHDVMLFTAWHPHKAPAYTSMAGALVHADVTMTAGQRILFGADDAPISLPALAQRCLHVVSPRATELARVKTALPDTYVSSSDAWDLSVPAGDSIGATGAQSVATGAERGSAASDADLTASFGNPFGGATMLVSTAAHWNREIHGTAGDEPRVVAVGTQTWASVAAPAGCAATPAVATAVPAVAIPSAAEINGTALGSDGTMVTLPPTGVATVTWTDAAAGVADDYVVLLVEATTVAGQATLTTVHGSFTAARTATFDAALMQPGHTYLFEVFAQQGIPNAAHGDFRTIQFPFADATSLSHLFTVVAAPGV